MAFRKEGEEFDYTGGPNVVLQAVKVQPGDDDDPAPMSMDALTGAPRADVIRNPLSEDAKPKSSKPRNRVRQPLPGKGADVGQTA
jgi:hypothetical protein